MQNIGTAHCAAKEEQTVFKLKPGSETITKTFRIPVDMSERLEQLAYKNNLSLNAVIIQCLQYALDNLDETAAEER